VNRTPESDNTSTTEGEKVNACKANSMVRLRRIPCVAFNILPQILAHFWHAKKSARIDGVVDNRRFLWRCGVVCVKGSQDAGIAYTGLV